jgi:hypothetical protein
VSVFELWARFHWEPGDCFKCEHDAIPVTRLGVLEGAAGAVELFACRACTFRLEHQLHGALSGTHVPPRRPMSPRIRGRAS